MLDRSIIDPDTGIPMGRININQHDQGVKIFSHAFDNYELQAEQIKIQSWMNYMSLLT